MIAPSRWKTFSVLAAVILGLLFTLPNVLPQSARDALPGFMPKKTLNLGLDLQGGSMLLLSVYTKALRVEKITNLIEDTRATLREEKTDFTDLGQVGSDVLVRITDPTKVNDAMNLLRNRVGAPLPNGTGRDVTISQGDDQHIKMTFSDQAMAAEAGKAVEQSIEIIRRRIDAVGRRTPGRRRVTQRTDRGVPCLDRGARGHAQHGGRRLQEGGHVDAVRIPCPVW